MGWEDCCEQSPRGWASKLGSRRAKQGRKHSGQQRTRCFTARRAFDTLVLASVLSIAAWGQDAGQKAVAADMKLPASHQVAALTRDFAKFKVNSQIDAAVVAMYLSKLLAQQGDQNKAGPYADYVADYFTANLQGAQAANVLKGLSGMFYKLDALGLGSDYSRRAYNLYAKANDPASAVTVLLDWATGDDDQDLAVRAWKEANALGNKDLTERAMLVLGSLAYSKGNYSASEAFFTEVLPYCRSRQDSDAIYDILIRLSTCAGYLSDPALAEKVGPELLNLASIRKDADTAALCVNNWGYAYLQTKRYPEAEAKFRIALSQAKDLRDIRGEWTALSNLGEVKFQSSDYVGALPFYRDSSGLARTVFPELAQDTDCREAFALQKLQRYVEAEKLIEGTESAWSEDNIPFAIVAAEHLLQCYHQMHQTSKIAALRKVTDDLFGEALNTAEVVNASPVFANNSGGSVQEIGFLRTWAAWDDIDRGDLKSALREIELSKARGLVETTDEGTRLHPMERQLYGDIAREAVGLSGDSARGQLLADELDALDHAKAIEAMSGSGGVTSLESLMAYNDLSKYLDAATEDALVLEFKVLRTTTIDEVHVIAVFKQGPQTKLRDTLLREGGQPVTAERLADLTRQFLAGLSQRPGPARTVMESSIQPVSGATAGPKLASILLDPIKELLAKNLKVVVCPDGPLWSLPFEALPVGSGSYLIDQNQVTYAYSILDLVKAEGMRYDRKRAKASANGLIIANPTFGAAGTDRSGAIRFDNLPSLPGADREARAIVSLDPGATLLSGNQATSTPVLKAMPAAKFIHFGTHGFANPDFPMLSGVVLAQPGPGESGFLTALDLQSLKLSADLVVLSACETGKGDYELGRGLVGLTWALSEAGASTQIVSCWSVDDASTADLMQSFYTGYLRAGKPKGVALCDAIREVKKKWPDPYYWAPFILVGDPR